MPGERKREGEKEIGERGSEEEREGKRLSRGAVEFRYRRQRKREKERGERKR